MLTDLLFDVVGTADNIGCIVLSIAPIAAGIDAFAPVNTGRWGRSARQLSS